MPPIQFIFLGQSFTIFLSLGLITARCRGIIKTQHFHIENPVDCKSPSICLKCSIFLSRYIPALFFPILEEYAPNITIQVDSVGLAQRNNVDSEKDSSAPPRSALATGSITINVPPVSKNSILSFFFLLFCLFHGCVSFFFSFRRRPC